MVDPIRDDAPARSIMDWPAIFAGAAIAAGITVVFTGFNAALGFGSFSVRTGEGPGTFTAILLGLFAFLTMLAAYGLGGYVAGRMRTPVPGVGADEVTARDGAHGLTMWAVSTLIGAILAFGAVSASLRVAGGAAGTAVEATGQAVGGTLSGAGQVAGGVISGVGQVAGGAISGVGQIAGGAVQGAGQAMGDGTLSDMLPEGARGNPLEYITERLTRPAGDGAQPYSDEDIQRQVTSIIGNVLSTGELSDADRDFLAKAIAARTNTSEADANARIDEAVKAAQDIRNEAQQRLDQAKQAATDAAQKAQDEANKLRDEAEKRLEEAKQAAIDAAETARRGAVWTAFALAASSLISAVVAFLAAIRGGRDRDEGRVWGGLVHGRR